MVYYIIGIAQNNVSVTFQRIASRTIASVDHKNLNIQYIFTQACKKPKARGYDRKLHGIERNAMRFSYIKRYRRNVGRWSMQDES